MYSAFVLSGLGSKSLVWCIVMSIGRLMMGNLRLLSLTSLDVIESNILVDVIWAADPTWKYRWKVLLPMCKHWLGLGHSCVAKLMILAWTRWGTLLYLLPQIKADDQLLHCSESFHLHGIQSHEVPQTSRDQVIGHFAFTTMKESEKSKCERNGSSGALNMLLLVSPSPRESKELSILSWVSP